MVKTLLECLVAFAISLMMICPLASADETSDGPIYYFANVVNTGLDTGFAGHDEITEADVHFGWELGQLAVSGYTGMKMNEAGYPVFLKTAGDKIKLSFELLQDIDKLNGNETLTINDDINGYDQHFGVSKTDFGRGALIVQQTNYQNATGEPQVYVDYLNGVAQGADTEVVLLEEGDYEVTLDYEIKNNPRMLGPVSVVPEYSNYKIAFKFAVRNGNCMVFPFDLGTGSELTNESYAPNGFSLDLARSRYLNVNVKKEVMAAGANGLVEDTRFNGPARDGDEYTEEGVYTVTASNQYTGQSTEKTIYVGDDPVLKAYAVTGLSIPEINQKVQAGYVITDDGDVVTVEEAAMLEQETSQINWGAIFAVVFVILIIAGIIARAVLIRRKRPEGEADHGALLMGTIAPQDTESPQMQNTGTLQDTDSLQDTNSGEERR